MNKLDLSDVTAYVEENIGVFHHKRIQSMQNLDLKKVLKRKNPYLFRAKNKNTASEIVESIVSAFVSSNEETIFGDWMEGLAIFVNTKVYGGYKSGIQGIDLEFDMDGIRQLVTIKSGPNWGNASQIKKMKEYFLAASRTLRTSNAGINIRCVNGCCYGVDNRPDKDSYQKLCGQRFWSYISANNELYTEIVEPLGHTAMKKNEEFQDQLACTLNRFTRQFTSDFCLPDGKINWNSLVQHNSMAKK